MTRVVCGRSASYSKRRRAARAISAAALFGCSARSFEMPARRRGSGRAAPQLQSRHSPEAKGAEHQHRWCAAGDCLARANHPARFPKFGRASVGHARPIRLGVRASGTVGRRSDCVRSPPMRPSSKGFSRRAFQQSASELRPVRRLLSPSDCSTGRGRGH